MNHVIKARPVVFFAFYYEQDHDVFCQLIERLYYYYRYTAKKRGNKRGSDMRDAIISAQKEALKAKDKTALATIRLITAALKDRDIAARSKGVTDGITDEEILAMLQTMIKQRAESVKLYTQGNRPELAAAENEEIKVIQQFLPQQLSGEELAEAISTAITESGAESVRDMGKVMAVLKTNFAGQIDFGTASGQVKQRLMENG